MKILVTEMENNNIENIQNETALQALDLSTTSRAELINHFAQDLPLNTLQTYCQNTNLDQIYKDEGIKYILMAQIDAKILMDPKTYSNLGERIEVYEKFSEEYSKKYKEVVEDVKKKKDNYEILEEIVKEMKKESLLKKEISEKLIQDIVWDPNLQPILHGWFKKEDKKEKCITLEEIANIAIKEAPRKWREGKEKKEFINLFSQYPELYPYILAGYIEKHTSRTDVIKGVIDLDIKGIVENIYNEKKEELEEIDKNIIQKIIVDKKALENDKKRYESTRELALYWMKDKRGANILHKLFFINKDLFNPLVDKLMSISSDQTLRNYFDGERTNHLLGRIYKDQILKKISDVRTETDKAIIHKVESTIQPPKIYFGINEISKDSVSRVFKEYVSRYRELTGSKESESDIFKYTGLTGKEDVEETLKRLLGIIYSPTMFEWIRDSKEYGIKEKSLFFVPDVELQINNKRSGIKEREFILNYLSWYINVKMLMGDSQNLINICSAWLNGKGDLNRSVLDLQKQIQNDNSDIWNQLNPTLSVICKDTKNKRENYVRKFLQASNTENIINKIKSNDLTNNAMIAGTLLFSVVNSIYESERRSDISKFASTLSKEFKGILASSSDKNIKIERIKEGLKKLGFEQTDKGLEIFQNNWKAITSLSFGRGHLQTVLLTDEGLIIRNPFHNMYEAKTTKEGVTREFDGGEDEVFVSWKQISLVQEVEFDNNVFADIVNKTLTTLSGFGTKAVEPDYVKKAREMSISFIKAKLPGKSGYLFELFAMKDAREVWSLLKRFAEVMQSEDGPESLNDLLSVLRNI